MMAETQSLRRRLFTPSVVVLFGDGTGEVSIGEKTFALRHRITRSHPKGVYMDLSGKRWDVSRARFENKSDLELGVSPAETLKLALFGTAKPESLKSAEPVAVTKASRKAKESNRRIAAKVGRIVKATAKTGVRKPVAKKKVTASTKTTKKVVRKSARKETR